MALKSKQLADWLGLASATIRLWAKEDEFGGFLSPSGRGGEGRTRAFDDQDARIIAHIARLKENGASRDDVLATLKTLEADDWIDLPPMPTAPPSVEPISLIPREAAESKVEAQRNALMREISRMAERIEELQEQLEQEREQHRKEREELLQGQKDLLREIAQLNREIGRLEGQMQPHKDANVD